MVITATKILFLIAIAFITPMAWSLPGNAIPHKYTIVDNPSEVFAVVVLENGGVIFLWQPAVEKGTAPLLHAEFTTDKKVWTSPTVVIQSLPILSGLCVVQQKSSEEIWLFYSSENSRLSHSLTRRRSRDSGRTWSSSDEICTLDNPLRLDSTAVQKNGTIVLLISSAEAKHVIHYCNGDFKIDTICSNTRTSKPILLSDSDIGLSLYFTDSKHSRRYVRQVSNSANIWSVAEAINLPSAVTEMTPMRTASLCTLGDGRMVTVGNDNVLRTGELSIRFSHDGGRTWPQRHILVSDAPGAYPQLAVDKKGDYHIFYHYKDTIRHGYISEKQVLENTRLNIQPQLENVIQRYNIGHPGKKSKKKLPIPDTPYCVHKRIETNDAAWKAVEKIASAIEAPGVASEITTAIILQEKRKWVGTKDGLYMQSAPTLKFHRYPSHGVNGPLATFITGIAIDSQDVLWVTTPGGLSACDLNGAWRSIRGRDGLPWEELTCITIDADDRLWLGSTRGLIQYCPYGKGRQWYYRAGQRYLPDDNIRDVSLTNNGRTVLALTRKGVGRIDEIPETLYSKAEYLEARFNERHRRLGLASYAHYDDSTLQHWKNSTQASDGLWTSYHITSMSLAYSLTQEQRYRKSAMQGMEALYLLQNITGIKGLVARSIAEVGTSSADAVTGQSNWQKAPDFRYIWRDDISNDQIDGHYMAFYSFFEHIAQFDPIERERIETQVRQVTDYILDNNYTIIDWNGKVTMWGHWEPEYVNGHLGSFAENGLASLQILSFLKTAYYITDDKKYLVHFRNLIEEHGYLSNLQLEKKLFPDELNHSDDQLAAVAYYPILQLEHNPFICNPLHAALQRHGAVESLERNAFFAFLHASINPKLAAIEGGVQTLREFTQDRRNYAMKNTHRTDIVIHPRPNRGGMPVLLEVLPYDEYEFERWNQDPYQPDSDGNGLNEGSGESYLLAYWMARFHGIIAPPTL